MLASPDIVHATPSFSTPGVESSDEDDFWGPYSPPSLGTVQPGRSALKNNDGPNWQLWDQVRYFNRPPLIDASSYLDVPRRNNMPMRCNMIPKVDGMVLIDLGEEWDDSWPCVAQVVEVCDNGYSLRVRLYRSECFGMHGMYTLRKGGMDSCYKVRTISHYFCSFSLQKRYYLSDEVKEVAADYAVKEFVKRRFIF